MGSREEKKKKARLAELRARRKGATEEDKLEAEALNEEANLGDEPQREFQMSDGHTVSVAQAHHHFRNKTKHLPEREQKILQVHYSRFRKYNGRKGGFNKRKWNVSMAVARKYQQEIIELYGRMFTTEEIVDTLRELKGIDVGVRIIGSIKTKFAEVIQAKIEAHQKDHSSLRLTHKKSRVEELTELYNKLKISFMEKPAPSTLNSLREVLTSIRNEVDGDLVVNGTLEVQLEHQIKTHFQRDIYKQANIQEMIIGKVATQMGVNPLMLMWSIENSYYKKFNAVDDTEDAEHEEIEFPSEQDYNYDEIESKYEQRTKERKAAALVTNRGLEVTPEQAAAFKEKMLKKLSKGKKTIKTKRSILAAITKAKEVKDEIKFGDDEE